MEQFILELFKVIDQKDDNQFNHSQTRRKLLNQWLDKWLLEVESSQLIMNPKHMTSEFKDFILNKLASECNEELIEEVIDFKMTDRRIEGKMFAIRKQKVGNEKDKKKG